MVSLSFRIFDLEADTLCRYDFVEVYNGHSDMVQKLGRFCGTFRPGTLISTSNTMMLQMESDSETGGRGFLAHFTGTKTHLNGIHHQNPGINLNLVFCFGTRTSFGFKQKIPEHMGGNLPII